jgi:HEAT repeat protein
VLIEATGKRYPSVRARVAAALGKVGRGAEVRAALRRLAQEDGETEVWRAACTALTRIGPEATHDLVALLAHPDRERRRHAANGLGEVGPDAREAVPTLLAAFNEDTETRRVLAEAVWLIGMDAQNIPGLLERLGDPDELVRLWLVRALVTFGPEAHPAVPALVNALADPAEMVRSSAAWALATIGPKALPPVLAALHVPGSATRAAVAEGLGRMRAREAHSALMAAQDDPDVTVRQRATEALARLESGTPLGALGLHG